MTARPIHLLSIGLLAALCCPVLSASDTEPLDPPTLLGSWVGEVISDSDLPVGYLLLDITSQQNRSFQGLIGLVPPNPIVPPNPVYPVDPIRMLLSANGNVSVSSQTEDWELNAQGVLEGSSLFLEYHINFRDGTQDFGLMLLSR